MIEMTLMNGLKETIQMSDNIKCPVCGHDKFHSIGYLILDEDLSYCAKCGVIKALGIDDEEEAPNVKAE